MSSMTSSRVSYASWLDIGRAIHHARVCGWGTAAVVAVARGGDGVRQMHVVEDCQIVWHRRLFCCLIVRLGQTESAMKERASRGWTRERRRHSSIFFVCRLGSDFGPSTEYGKDVL
jgi:hypothetical protein